MGFGNKMDASNIYHSVDSFLKCIQKFLGLWQEEGRSKLIQLVTIKISSKVPKL